MTLSQQENSLTFDEKNGDLKETADICAQRGRVLTNLQARALAKIALRIRAIFGNKSEQDIEWGILRGQIYVLQSRPYLEKK
jgi:phosphoenolpyruvate synthase/pyruvate phosphate dikinase